MSGGSYEYLCLKEAGELVNGVDERIVQAMADRLAGLGYADAAQETNELLLEVRAVRSRLDARLSRINGVWKAVEWMDSGDWGQEAVDKAVRAYRGVAE